MTCHRFVFHDGNIVGFVCTNKRGPRAPCAYCSTKHEFLCDHRAKPRGRRCSKKLCVEHAQQVGDDEHLCPDHVKIVERSVLHVFTGNCNRHRKDPDAFDVTIMSGGVEGKPFAPSAIIFNAARRSITEVTMLENTARVEEIAGRLDSADAMRKRAVSVKRTSFEIYRRAFLAEMLVSSGSRAPAGWERDADDARARGVECHQKSWDALLKRSRITLLCYCEGREFCHRGLLVQILVRKGAVDGGELPVGNDAQGNLFGT